MSVQSPVQGAVAGADHTPAANSLLRRHGRVRSRLEKAYENHRRVALVIGVDSYEIDHVIGAFLGGLDERTTAVRLRQPQENALAALAEINRAIGFDPKDLTLTDLQQVLTLFLEYQSRHRQRTVLCVERADEQSMWLLDCIARLLRNTESSRIGQGLLVILSGSGRLVEALGNGAFDDIRRQAETPIRLGPLSIFETRAFLRQLSGNAGFGDIQGLFEFDAVERLHNLAGGTPHHVAKLFRECVLMVKEKGIASATSKTVVAAAQKLRADAAFDSRVKRPKPAVVSSAPATSRRLEIRCPDEAPRELELRPGRYMVGRADSSDIRLSSQTVSRRHALLISTAESLQVLDLGSVNGVYANKDRVAEAVVEAGTVLTFGECTLEYLPW